MKQGDYQSIKKAKRYRNERFANGLALVSQDELRILDYWLSGIKKDKMQVFLDLGSGTGRVVKILLKYHPKNIYTLDPSAAMLSILKENYKRATQKSRIKIIQAYSDKIPLSSKSIDVATSLHLLKHLPNLNPTIKEINRILKPGGYFIFDILNKDSLVRFNLGTCFAVSETEITNNLNKNGFVIEDVIYMHIFGETVYNLLGIIGAGVLQPIDSLIRATHLKIGTKIFILAKKYG